MEQIVSLDNLCEAYRKACQGKQRKKEVLAFAENFDANIALLRQDLVEGTMRFGDYHYFTIHDPKERLICAAPFRERVAHHAIMNICHPYFDRQLIDTTYATRKGKGVYAALEKAVEAMSHYRYSVKLDVRKYYDSIDHDELKRKLRRMFKDTALLRIFDKIIDSYSCTEGKGLPIGNLTSQYFANAYLSELDHKVKEQWGVPIYVRYMDDILIVGNDQALLKRCVTEMNVYIDAQLKLQFKPPVFRSCKDGQVFLGYRVMPYRCLLSGRSKRRFRSKLLKYDKNLNDGTWNEQTYTEHVLPLLAFAEHAESKQFRSSCISIIKGDNRREGRTACTVVAAGTTTRGTVAYRIATTTRPVTATTTLASASPSPSLEHKDERTLTWQVVNR